MRQFFPRNTIFIIFLVITLSIFSPLLVRASLYQPGETLNPDCTPGSPNCGVVVGVGFSQGGNSFGTPADLGTNDNYALNFRANSSTVLTILPSGNVGIGTTTPANKLDVNGGVRVVGNLEIGSFQPAASGNLQLFQGSGYYGIQSYNNWPLAINPLGNNVGIGTTTPETKLSVVLSGNQYVNISGSNLVIQSSNATGALIQVTGTGAADLLGLYDNNNPALVVKDGGYVGIGTSNPNQRLDVSGRRILLGSNVGDEGFGRTDGVGKIGSVLFPHRLNSEEPISGMILYSNTANRNDLYFGGGVENIPINAVTDIYFYTASNPTTLTGTERMHITSTGRIGIGTSSPVATLSVMGTSSDPTLNPFVVASSTGLDLFVVSPSGNVGIGTPPQALISEKLAVQGTIIAKDWTTAGYPNLFVGDDVFLTDLDISNTMGIYGNSDINQAHLRLGATGITLSGVNDKLGVGTTTPADKLDVAGKIQFNSMAIARSGSLGVLPSSQTGLYFGYDSGNDRAFFASGLTDGSGSFTTRKAALFDYATFLFTRDGSNADMFISSLGRIGIGTTSPVTSLFVQGKPGVDPFFVASATGTSLFTVNQTGNVGVGIQNPQAKLQVALGDILVSSAGATAGTPLVDSGSLILRGAYWNGSQSIDVNSYFKNVVLSNATSSPNSQLEFYVAGERVASLRNISNPPYPEPARDFRVYGATGVPAIFSLIAGNGTDYADYTYNGADADIDVSAGGLNLRPLAAGASVKVWNSADNVKLRIGSQNFSQALDLWNNGVDSYIQSTAGSVVLNDQLNVSEVIYSVKPLAPVSSNLANVASTDSKLLLYSNSASNWSGLGTDDGGNTWLRTGTSGTNLFVFGSSGRMGIGTTSPNQKLHVRFTGDDYMRIEQIAANNYGIIFQRNDGVNNNSWFLYQPAGTTDFRFYNNGDQVTIKNTGNVGLGTDSPNGKLTLSVAAEGTVPSLGSPSVFLNITPANQYGLIAGVLGNGSAYLQAQRTDGTTTAYSLLLQPNGGNVGIGTTTPTLGPLVMASGAYVTTGGVWTNASDRNLKENFVTLSPANILEKINTLPIMQWNYKAEDPSITHIGPTAQDFYTAFGLGGISGKTSISTIDPAGVALLGIQALSQKLTALQGSLEGNLKAPVLSVYTPTNFSGDSVGEAKILAGQKLVRVKFKQTYTQQPIVTVTPTDETALISDFKYAVTDKDNTGFTIKLNNSVQMDLTFDWHAFASPEARLIVSDGSTQLIDLVVNDLPSLNSVLSPFVIPSDVPDNSATTTILDPISGSTIDTPSIVLSTSSQSLLSPTTETLIPSVSDSSVVTDTNDSVSAGASASVMNDIAP